MTKVFVQLSLRILSFLILAKLFTECHGLIPEPRDYFALIVPTGTEEFHRPIEQAVPRDILNSVLTNEGKDNVNVDRF